MNKDKYCWNLDKVEKDLHRAFCNNSERELLSILKDNSFLFYDLYSRKFGIQPIFREVGFGNSMRCDFAWLNDNSDGPEWVLVEIEKPKMRLFNKNGRPSSELNGAIEQVKTWQRYFEENPHEKRRIFGAVSRFRYILVCGDITEWNKEHAMKWRAFENTESSIEVRSSNVFYKSLTCYKESPATFWSFEDNPKTLSSTKLENYWKNYEYMDRMRKLF